MELKTNGITLQASDEQVATEKKPVVIIPYYAWANRGPGEMQLWFPEKIKDIEVIASYDKSGTILK